MSRLPIVLGVVVLAIAFGAAPIPLTVTLQDPVRPVTIYPNILFAAPLILLGALLLLYGAAAKDRTDPNAR
jgi:peptidoglycan/LPS O-acetylase OafA/YrhL